MRKIIITFLILSLSITQVFAWLKLDFSSDKKEYNIDENIIINIDISGDNSKWNLSIKWIENFNVVLQNQSESVSIINWKITTNKYIKLYLAATKAWEYDLWPISINWKDFWEPIKLKITWERLMINPNIKKKVSSNNKVEKQDFDKIDLSWNENNISSKKVIWINWEEMIDIYPQKWFLIWDIFSKLSLYFLLISLILFFLFWLIKKYIPLLISSKVEAIEHKKIVKKKVNYEKLINEIEEKYFNKKKEVFYSKLWNLFRIYLDDKVWDWLSKKSLSEIRLSKKLDKNLLELYQKVYYPEYDNLWDDIDKRKDILKQTKKLFIKP